MGGRDHTSGGIAWEGLVSNLLGLMGVPGLRQQDVVDDFWSPCAIRYGARAPHASVGGYGLEPL